MPAKDFLDLEEKKNLQKALNQKNGSTRLLVRKKGEKTSQEYLISLNNSLAQTANPEGERPMELVADEQEFDQNRQIITARGNVTLRFAESVLTADRLQINLPEKLAVAEGQVILTRGDQILRGDRFEYYFVQDSGVVFNANGEIFQPSTARDLGQTLPTDVGSGSSFATLTDALEKEFDKQGSSIPADKLTKLKEYTGFVLGAQMFTT